MNNILNKSRLNNIVRESELFATLHIQIFVQLIFC